MSNGMAEVMNMQISMKGGIKIDIALACVPYVPSKTRAGSERDYIKMVADRIDLKNID